MSSTQSFSFTANAENINSIKDHTTGSVGNFTEDGHLANFTGSSNSYVYFNDIVKNALFPNLTAFTTSVYLQTHFRRGGLLAGTAYSGFAINNNNIVEWSNSSSDWKTYSTTTTIDNLSKQNLTSIAGYGRCTGFASSYGTYISEFVYTFYFTRYDFSASTSTGITSASVSSATGYDGDTITFTASLQSGYTFDGWYNGSTKVSSNQTYVHTVAGADMALTAKAIASTKTVTTKYGTTTIATEQRMPPVAVSYGSTQIASISSGETKTLNCSDNLMSSNLTVGGKSLLCANQIMNGNIIVSVS